MGFPYGLGTSRTILEISMSVKKSLRNGSFQVGAWDAPSDERLTTTMPVNGKFPAPASRDSAFPHRTSPSETDSEATPFAKTS